MKITALALVLVFLCSIVAPATAAGIGDLENKVKSSKIGEEQTACDPKTPCPPGQVCVDGVCKPACDPKNPCPPGQVCVDGVCKPACDPKNPCPPGKVCVDGVCKDDPNACSPENPCPPGKTCVDGVCRDNPAGAGNDCPGGDCGKAGGFLQKIGDFFKKLFAPVIDFFKKIFQGGGNDGGNNGGGCTGPDCPPTTPIGPPPTGTTPTPPPAAPEPPATPVNPPTTSNGQVKTLTSANFGNEVLNQKGVVVVDLYATWCGPCKQFAPTYDRLAKNMTDVKFGKVDVDQARDLYSRYGGGGVPTLVIFKDGKPVKKMTGGQNYESFKRLVESYK